MINPAFILGYHGCPKNIADAVLRGDIPHLKVSDSRYEWLGRGVYFWENSYARAMEWAKSRCKGEEVAVLGAIIVPGKCLDLTDSGCLESLAEACKVFEKSKPQCANSGLSHRYDCELLNFFHRYWKMSRGEVFDTIRAPFAEGVRIGESSFSSLNHIQWAVRNPEKSIIGYFRPVSPSASRLARGKENGHG